MYQSLSPKIISQNSSAQEILDILLENRNIKDKEKFLNPKLKEIKLPNLKKAAKIIKKAIENKKNILIYGDYDVDGITATAILWRTLKKLKANVFPFIPHREIDGYGFKDASFFRFQKEKNIKFDLIITVDNGIVANFNKIDCDIIVTDHHIPNEKLPKVKAIIHTTNLSGSGIAYALAYYLDKSADIFLAALGTVSDCLPLIGQNRQIVIDGLKQINKLRNPAIKKLLEVAKIDKQKLSTYDLGFIIGPHINATGRLADPTDSLRFLCCDNLDQINKYAKILHSNNLKRQEIQSSALDECLPKAKTKDKLLFFADEKYLPGIIGLIAGKLCDKYYKPVVIISKEKDYSKGSCRSIPEVNIIESLREFSNLFEDLGGHSQAAGFTIKTSNIEKLRKKLTSYFNKKLKNTELLPTTLVDAQMEIDAVNLKNIKAINLLEPFGVGNPRPTFLFKDIKVDDIRLIGSNKEHLKFKFSGIDALAFRQSDIFSKVKIGQAISIVGYLDINIWQDTSKAQIIISNVII
jgi:single-stranded-DNA-specific exonuclease